MSKPTRPLPVPASAVPCLRAATAFAPYVSERLSSASALAGAGLRKYRP